MATLFAPVPVVLACPPLRCNIGAPAFRADEFPTAVVTPVLHPPFNDPFQPTH